MYRSNCKKEDTPIVLQHPISEFQDGVETPYLMDQTFVERVSNFPMVRSVYGRVQTIYENAKDRSSLLNSALSFGESTVQFSLNQAASVMYKTGLSSRLEKPLKIADVVGCHILDKVEAKLPIVTKSPYEIKMMVGQKVEDKVDQLQSAKENAVERVRDYKRMGNEKLENVKQMGADKIQAVMDTEYGRTVNQAIENGLNTMDDVVEKYLPERHSHKNGNASNGHIVSNGVHMGNLEHVKKISYKVTRRLSLRVQATSHHVVDAVIQTPGVSALHSTIVYVRHTSRTVVAKPVQFVREKVAFATAKAYVTMVDGVAKVVDFTHWALMMVLPRSLQAPVNMFLDKSVSFVVKSGFHVPPPVEIPEELVENY